MYNTDMPSAARRHLHAGEILHASNFRKDVAGYIFGLAAECALKTLMQNLGMTPLPIEDRKDDPFYAHFENLKTLLRDSAQGRRYTELRRFAENSSFMQFWDVQMRYSDGKAIRSEWVDRWRDNAKDIIGVMDT